MHESERWRLPNLAEDEEDLKVEPKKTKGKVKEEEKEE